MKLMFVLAALAVAASAQRVSVEFDEGRDYSGFRTFAVVDGVLHSRNPALNNPLVKKKIEAAIRARLTEKGLKEVAGRPDLNVRYSLGASPRTQLEPYPTRWRGTRLVREHYTEGTLMIDLRDARRHELLWRAVAIEDKAGPLEIQDHLADMVKRALAKYPPKKK